MKKLAIILSTVAYLLLGAHYLYHGNGGMVLVALTLPLGFFIARRWVRIIQLLGLIAGSFIWLMVTFQLVHIRMIHQMPWLRLGLILGTVTLLTVVAAMLLFRFDERKNISPEEEPTPWAVGVFILTAAMTFMARS